MKKKIVSFQGIDGAYSDLVCRKFYPTYRTFPCETFQKTLDAVSKRVANLALIPVENNILLFTVNKNNYEICYNPISRVTYMDLLT